MSVQADQQRDVRRHWARPGGSHDRLVRLLKNWLPMAVGVLSALLATAPFTGGDKVSFVLDKNKVEVAKERMRVSAATYRGEDSKGQPFELKAGSAVQTSSRDPVVRLQDLSANIALSDGPAMLRADRGRYDMDREIVSIDGPVTFTSADGYKLQTRDVAVGLKTRKLASGGPVTGQMPLGNFSANSLQADLGARVVTLDGRARLHIVQGRAR